MFHNTHIQVQKFPMSVRQKQLSSFSPAKVIELSYLSALLEQPPHQSMRAFSTKMDTIRRFLEKIVEVVPIESIGHAANCENPYVADRCRKVIKALGLESILSMLSTQEYSDSAMIGISSSIICDLDLTSLYASASGFQSPIDTLKVGREKLICLNLAVSHVAPVDVVSPMSLPPLPGSLSQEPESPPTLSQSSSGSSLVTMGGPPFSVSEAVDSPPRRKNSEMLDTVNQIRMTDLALCISLVASFINQQPLDIPLSAPGTNDVSSEGLHVHASALASFGLDKVCYMLTENHKRQILVRVKASAKKDTDLSEMVYAEKLYFLTQCLKQNVAFSRNRKSYSLERQLVSICHSLQINEYVSISNLVRDWEQHFQSTTLSLVPKSHRPLIARWLKWALMVHNLREELAKYTAVGVVGLVNSGKSKLINTLYWKLKYVLPLV